MTRKKSRESAFQVVFEMNLNDIDADESFLLAEETGEPQLDDFSKALIKSVFENKEQIERMIQPHLKGWSIKRISKAALAVLQISCAQMLFFDDISDGIVINEAVELAKRFGADDDYAFVNGVLGSIVRGENAADEEVL